MAGRARAVFLLGSLLVACGTEKGAKQASARPPTAAELPAMVVVEAQNAQLGLWRGRLSQEVAVSGFSITKQPITQGAYQACLAAGACSAAKQTCRYRRDGEQIKDDSANPARCVGLAGAAAYCSWIGGKLPTPAQWLLAARGSKTARFAWGELPPSCARHPLGRVSLDEAGERGLPPEAIYDLFYGHRVEPCVADPAQRFHVGEHPAGASPFGLEDVLLTASELVAAVDKTIFAACRIPRAGCLVQTGELPGSIDSFSTFRVKQFLTTSDSDTKPTDQVGVDEQLGTDAPVDQTPEYGFRCVAEVAP